MTDKSKYCNTKCSKTKYRKAAEKVDKHRRKSEPSMHHNPFPKSSPIPIPAEENSFPGNSPDFDYITSQLKKWTDRTKRQIIKPGSKSFPNPIDKFVEQRKLLVRPFGMSLDSGLDSFTPEMVTWLQKTRRDPLYDNYVITNVKGRKIASNKACFIENENCHNF